MTNDDISCFLYFSVIPSKKSRCFWLSNSGGLMVDDPPKIAGRYTKELVDDWLAKREKVNSITL